MTPHYEPSEASLELVIAGKLPDPVPMLTGADLRAIEQTRLCPRDGRALQLRDNPRNPGLNCELHCSCGFAFTT